jgi:hypothetical protein
MREKLGSQPFIELGRKFRQAGHDLLLLYFPAFEHTIPARILVVVERMGKSE